jgi:hypothetical protein
MVRACGARLEIVRIPHRRLPRRCRRAFDERSGEGRTKSGSSVILRRFNVRRSGFPQSVVQEHSEAWPQARLNNRHGGHNQIECKQIGLVKAVETAWCKLDISVVANISVARPVRKAADVEYDTMALRRCQEFLQSMCVGVATGCLLDYRLQGRLVRQLQVGPSRPPIYRVTGRNPPRRLLNIG